MFCVLIPCFSPLYSGREWNITFSSLLLAAFSRNLVSRSLANLESPFRDVKQKTGTQRTLGTPVTDGWIPMPLIPIPWARSRPRFIDLRQNQRFKARSDMNHLRTLSQSPYRGSSFKIYCGRSTKMPSSSSEKKHGEPFYIGKQEVILTHPSHSELLNTNPMASTHWTSFVGETLIKPTKILMAKTCMTYKDELVKALNLVLNVTEQQGRAESRLLLIIPWPHFVIKMKMVKFNMFW